MLFNRINGKYQLSILQFIELKTGIFALSTLLNTTKIPANGYYFYW